MRYMYSVIRFVPEPVRGECVNVGLIVGSDEAQEWHVRALSNTKRARNLDVNQRLRHVVSFVDDLGRDVDRYNDAAEAGAVEEQQVSEAWLDRLWSECRNLVQLSQPAPMLADSAVTAAELLADQFLLDPEANVLDYRRKSAAQRAVRTALREMGLVPGEDFTERSKVRGAHHGEEFDFVVGNGRAVQLAQTWSFQLPDQDKLAEDIKAWAFTVLDIRSHGGEAKLGQRLLTVRENVDVNAVYVAPLPDGPTAVFVEAMAAFREVGAEAREDAEAVVVARKAHALLAAAH